MAISKKVLNNLAKKKVKYKVVKHKKVYSAYDAAQTLKRKPKEIAKALALKADQQVILVVIPSSYRLDMAKIKKFLKAKKVELAPEKFMTKVLDMAPGMINPFTAAANAMPVYVDKALAGSGKILAAAGSYEESLDMQAKDFLKAVEAQLGSFGKFTKKRASVAKGVAKKAAKKRKKKKVAKKKVTRRKVGKKKVVKKKTAPKKKKTVKQKSSAKKKKKTVKKKKKKTTRKKR